MSHPQIRLIHVAARELGLDADTRHELQLVTTGKASLADMTPAELDKVVDALKARGFKPGRKVARKGRQVATRGDVRFIHVLWGKLVKAGAVDGAGAKGLNAFIRRRFEAAWGSVPLDVDLMQDAAQIATVIEALKAMSLRAGIKL
jgi:phage gp16-like protein